MKYWCMFDFYYEAFSSLDPPVYCLILGDNAGEDGGIITAHVLNLWDNRRARCPFLFSSAHSIFPQQHKRFCWSQRSPAKRLKAAKQN